MVRPTSPSSRPRAAALVLAAAGLTVSLVPGLVTGSARAADDTYVGKGEYKSIHGGIGIQKLSKILGGQLPFADTAGKGKKKVRWYLACEEWQPDKDVAVTYRQPVVGRRTVTKKALDVYVAARAAG